MSRRDLLWILPFTGAMAAIVVGMFWLRHQVVDGFTPSRDAVAWRDWRDATQSDATGSQPVERRSVTTDTPPGYVLLRDHFVTCVVGVVVTSAVPIGVSLWLLRGALGFGPRGRGRSLGAASESGPRGSR